MHELPLRITLLVDVGTEGINVEFIK